MKRLSIISMFVLLYAVTFAETVRDISISADKPYTDNISLARESGDMDVMVKFSFNEQDNQITVSLTSYRGLFVFRDDVRYKQVVKCSKLKVEALPYVATTEPVPYKMPYKFRKQLGKNRSKYVFRRWISYSGVVPEPMEYQMVNDVIEQKFTLVGEKRTSLTITLGDILIMEPKTGCCKKPYYEFLHIASADTKYRITIVRDPCFAMEEQVSIAEQQVAAVKQAFEGLKGTFPDRTTTLQETFDLFNNTKAMLKEQFPPRDTTLECPAINKANAEYNTFVDSISAFKCQLVKEEDDTYGLTASPAYLLSVAYSLDMNVSRWMLTTDEMERRDIIEQSNKYISDAMDYLGIHGARTPEMKSAYEVLQKAIAYYQKQCHVK